MEDRKPDAFTSVSREELLDAVTFARKFSYSNVPILDNVKLTIRDNGNVRVRATDLETDVVSNIEGDGGENPVELLIDKKKLAETLKSLNDDSVRLEFFAGEYIPDACPGCKTTDFDAPVIDEEGKPEEVLTPSPVPESDIKASDWDEKTCAKCGYVGKSTDFYPPNILPEFKVGKFFTLHPNLNVDEYPTAGEFPEDLETAVTTTVGGLKKVIGAATPKDDERGLSAVKFNEADGLIVATDGHRLHTIKAGVDRSIMLSGNTLKKIIAGEKDDDFVIIRMESEAPTLKTEGLKKAELIAMWEKHSGEKLPASMTVADIKEKMETKMNPKNAYLEDGNRKITMRLMEDRFPNYNVVMNREGNQDVSVKIGTLREGMKQALALTNASYMAVSMSFNGGIDLETQVEGDSYNRTSVAIESGGVEPPITHNYNAKYINDVLSLFKNDDELTLSVPSGTTPLFFRDDAGFEALVMPTRV